MARRYCFNEFLETWPSGRLLPALVLLSSATASLAGPAPGTSAALQSGAQANPVLPAGTPSDQRVEQAAGDPSSRGVEDNRPKPPPGATPLMRAALRGDLEAIDEELANGADVNEQDPHGYTALAHAAAAGRVPAIKYLLQRGANIDLAEQFGATPLMQAIAAGQTEAAVLLIERGANVNVRMKRNRNTPLIIAAWHGRERIVAVLLDNGAKISYRNQGNADALMTAIERRHKAIVRPAARAWRANRRRHHHRTVDAGSGRGGERRRYDQGTPQSWLGGRPSRPAWCYRGHACGGAWLC